MVDSYDDPIASHLLQANDQIEYYKSLQDDNCLLFEETKIRMQELLINDIKLLLTDFARQLTLKQDEFLVSFLPKGCEPVYNSNRTWNKKNRQSGKPGKIIQKVIGEGKFKPAEYEQFVYRLKSHWLYGEYEFKLVSGEDIRFWYNCENYYSRCNTLGNSCMSHPQCASYFDLYVEQPECQMLIALKEGKLAARALVWTIDDKTFMDRVYYIEDSLYNTFVNYAKDKKWIIRDDNSLLHDDETQYFRTPKDNYESSDNIEFTLKLKRTYEYWPYIDSFRFLILDSKELTTSPPNNIGIKYVYCSCTDGGYNGGSVECPICGCEWDSSEDLIYSEWMDEHGCEECMCWSEIMYSYIRSNQAIRIRFQNGVSDWVCTDWIDYENEGLHISDLKYVYLEGAYRDTSDSNVEFNEEEGWHLIR